MEDELITEQNDSMIVPRTGHLNRVLTRCREERERETKRSDQRYENG